MRRRFLSARQVLFALVCCAAASLAPDLSSQTQMSRQSRPTGVQAPRHILPPGMRTLSLKEGRELAHGVAWADDEEGLAPDCSHLVHTLYEQAGYSYPYATSVDLYHGTAQGAHFVRVRYAQPGDLIVWPGHVGIVVDPVEHSFFSTTSSGARAQDYSSAYWQARGRPRFYRYFTSKPKRSEETLVASNRPPGRLQDQSQDNPPKAEAGPRSAGDRPAVQTVKTASTKTTPGAEKPRGELAHADPAPGRAVLPDNSSPLLLHTGGKPPKAADVTAVLAEANRGAGEILRASSLERLEQPVVVYRTLQVGTVEVKGKRGTAQVQFETVAALSAERMESQQGTEEHKLELQRTKKGWALTPPSTTVYVSRDAALRVLAERLVTSTQNAVTSEQKVREQADIIRVLNLLVD